MIDQETHNKIERYLNNAMNSKEKLLFEELLKENSQVRKTVDEYRKVNEIIVDNELIMLKKKLENIHESHSSSKKNYNVYRYSIILILLTGLAYLLYDLGWKKEENWEDPVFASQNDMDDIGAVPFLGNESNEPEKVKTEKERPTTNENPTHQSLIDRMTGDTSKLSIQLLDSSKFNVVSDKEQREKEVVKINRSKEKETKVLDYSDTKDTEMSCNEVESMTPSYSLKEPCFGNGMEVGNIRFTSIIREQYGISEFSIDGGKTFDYNPNYNDINPGDYLLQVKTENGCLSKQLALKVSYGKCNYVINPEINKYLELDIREQEYPIEIQVLDGRNASLVYNRVVDADEVFIWKGIDKSNRKLSLGNYVIIISSPNTGLLARGQVTIIR